MQLWLIWCRRCKDSFECGYQPVREAVEMARLGTRARCGCGGVLYVKKEHLIDGEFVWKAWRYLNSAYKKSQGKSTVRQKHTR